MKVTITADGTAGGTRVTLEDGTDITEHVADVAFRHRRTDPPKFQITLVMQKASVAGEISSVLGPTGKKVFRIEYEDGSIERYGLDPKRPV